VYVVAVFDHPTIAALAKNLVDNYAAAMARTTGDAQAAPAREIAANATMTPADVLWLRDKVAALAVREPPPKRVVKLPRAAFVLSSPRAGSTLFRLMLAGNPALFAPQEVGLLAFDELGDRRPLCNGFEWMPEGILRAIMELKGWSVEESKAFLAECEQKRMSTFELYGILQGWAAPRLWVDKTTIHALDATVLRRMEKDFKDPFYIHLTRHPLGMINSFEKVRMDQFFMRWQEKPPFSVRQLAELTYQMCEENILRFLSRIPEKRQYRIGYEAVIKDPARELLALCERLGVPFDEEMIHPHRNGEQKMADGLYKDKASRQVGDPNFHKHTAINASRADGWKEEAAGAALGEMTLSTARLLGYE